jgi:hypothetical protein
MTAEYRVLTFFPEKQAQGLEALLQEAADDGFGWVDMISRDRLIYIIMRREKKSAEDTRPADQSAVQARPTRAGTVAQSRRLSLEEIPSYELVEPNAAARTLASAERGGVPR